MYGDYGSYSPTSDVASTGIGIGMLIGSIIGGLIGYAIGCFILSRIFKKAGRKPFEAWVPILSTWRLFEMGDKPGWWAILMAVPIINFVALVMLIIAWANILKSFGKPSWWVVLLIFFPIIPIIVLAFTDVTWQGGGSMQPINSGAPTPPAAPSAPSFPASEQTFSQPFQPAPAVEPAPTFEPVTPEPAVEPAPAFEPVTPEPAAPSFESSVPAPSVEPTEPTQFTPPTEPVAPEVPVEPTDPNTPAAPTSSSF